jgi:hypothetical protein
MFITVHDFKVELSREYKQKFEIHSIFISKVPQQLFSSTRNHHAGGKWQPVPAAVGFRTRDLQIILYRVNQKKDMHSWKKFTSVYENFQ